MCRKHSRSDQSPRSRSRTPGHRVGGKHPAPVVGLTALRQQFTAAGPWRSLRPSPFSSPAGGLRPQRVEQPAPQDLRVLLGQCRVTAGLGAPEQVLQAGDRHLRPQRRLRPARRGSRPPAASPHGRGGVCALLSDADAGIQGPTRRSDRPPIRRASANRSSMRISHGVPAATVHPWRLRDRWRPCPSQSRWTMHKNYRTCRQIHPTWRGHGPVGFA